MSPAIAENCISVWKVCVTEIISVVVTDGTEYVNTMLAAILTPHQRALLVGQADVVNS